ncbi:hypothetical protein ACFFRR_001691 [Megaselia abdita]
MRIVFKINLFRFFVFLKSSNKDKMIILIIILLTILKDSMTYQPEFSEPILNISHPVGRDITFTCNVRHLGGYRVGWLKADTKAIQAIHEHVITHNPRVSVTHSDQNTWNLHIKSITEEDRGGYMCQLNTDPMKSQIGFLDVVIPPDFIAEETSSDVIVPEGSPVKLTCRARGYPEPVVTFRREDGKDIVLKDSSGTKNLVPFHKGEILKLNRVSRNEMGNYLCIASNQVPPSVSKRIALSIHFHPVIQVPNQLVGAPLGTDVQIECHVEASPKSINYWIKDADEMIVASNKYGVTEIVKSQYETKMTIIVRNFQKEDVGSYRCIAKNSLGEVDSSIRLYEIPRPHHKSKHGGGTETNDILKHKTGKHKPIYSGNNNHHHSSNNDDEDLNGSAEDFDDDSDSEKMSIKPTNRPYNGNHHSSDKNRNHYYGSDTIIESPGDFDSGRGNIHVTYKPHNNRGSSQGNIFGNAKENTMDNKGISISTGSTSKHITAVVILLVLLYKVL